MKHLTFLICLILFVILPACDFINDYMPKALTEEDIKQYTKAYDNIAKASPQIEQEQKADSALLVFTCKPCMKTLEKAVQDAGYKNFTSFLIIDIRVHLAMRHYAYLQISQMVREGLIESAPEDFCAKITEKELEQYNDEERKEVLRNCKRINTISKYLKVVSKYVGKIAETLSHEGDIEVIGKMHDAIVGAWTDSRLIDEFEHVQGGGFDD